MIDVGERGEQQSFDLSKVSSDKGKHTLEGDNASSSLLAALHQDVQALGDGNLSETEQKQVATREHVSDERGNIIDVIFQQNGKRRNLKSLLPGTYTIEITSDEQARSEADKKENKISVNASNGRDFNLSLLHEAGHMVDFQTNQRVYQQVEEEMLKARLSEMLFTSKILEMSDGKNRMPETTAFCQKIIEEEKANFTSEEIEEITTACDQVRQRLTGEQTLAVLRQEREEWHALLLRKATLGEVQRERNAWANALKALHTLQRQGITAFAGTREDLFQAIERALDSYEFFSGENLSPTDRHFTRNLSLK